jgi:hypothetical protein
VTEANPVTTGPKRISAPRWIESPNSGLFASPWLLRNLIPRFAASGDKQNRFDVDFIAQATRLGEPSAHAGQNIQGTVPASALDKIKAEGICNQNSLELPRGVYRVRFVVRDNLNGKTVACRCR